MIEGRARWKAAAACAALVLAAACGGSGSDLVGLTGTIRGTVTDVETGTPLPDAVVHFGTSGGVTAANGTYTIDAVPQGGLTLKVERAGYWRYNGWVVFVVANGVLVRDVAMSPMQASASKAE